MSWESILKKPFGREEARRQYKEGPSSGNVKMIMKKLDGKIKEYMREYGDTSFTISWYSEEASIRVVGESKETKWADIKGLYDSNDILPFMRILRKFWTKEDVDVGEFKAEKYEKGWKYSFTLDFDER